MKSENLDDLKGRLYEAFDRVMDIAKEDLEIGTIPNRTLAATLLTAASQMTQSIAAIEREQREAGDGQRFAKIKAPG